MELKRSCAGSKAGRVDEYAIRVTEEGGGGENVEGFCIYISICCGLNV